MDSSSQSDLNRTIWTFLKETLTKPRVVIQNSPARHSCVTMVNCRWNEKGSPQVLIHRSITSCSTQPSFSPRDKDTLQIVTFRKAPLLIRSDGSELDFYNLMELRWDDLNENERTVTRFRDTTVTFSPQRLRRDDVGGLISTWMITFHQTARYLCRSR